MGNLFKMKWSLMSSCYHCECSEKLQDEEILMLHLDLKEKEISTQALLDNYFADSQLGMDSSTGIDCKCGKVDVQGYGKTITCFPPILIVVLKRYRYDQYKDTTLKDRRCIMADHYLRLGMHAASNPIKGSKEHISKNLRCESDYVLRPVVLHHGELPSQGHYTSLMYLTESAVLHCDDANVMFANRDAVSLADTDGYIFMYENAALLYHEMIINIPATICAVYTRAQTRDLLLSQKAHVRQPTK